MKLIELRLPLIDLYSGQPMLSESISEYFSLVLAQLRSKTPEQLFNGVYALDLDKLAEVISGLKILCNVEMRDTLSDEDLGINPHSYQDLFKLLKSIPRNSNDTPRLTSEVFAAIKSTVPSVYRETRRDLEILRSGDKHEREEVIGNVARFVANVNKLFTRVKQGAAADKTNPPGDKSIARQDLV